jgi:hypothetical protein
MSERTSDAVHLVREQAASLAQAIVEQAANRALFSAERARGVASQAKGRVPNKVGEELVPSVREVALHAAAAALELWQTARERAEDVVEHAEQELKEPALHAVEEAEQRAKKAAASVVHRADDVSERARLATKSAAETTVSTGKDTAATLIWSAAAAGIVFYILMDKDRRDQVLKTIEAVALQAREIVRDFKGYDEEFI